MNSKILFALCTSLTLLLSATSASAQANSAVTFEGEASYQTSGPISRVQMVGAVSRINNFSYDETFESVRVAIVLAKKPHTPGSDLVGPFAATSSVISSFAPRTYYNNISLSGSMRMRRGTRYAPVLIALDNQSRILAFHNFSKQINLRAAKRMAKVTNLRMLHTNGNDIAIQTN